MNRLLFAFLLIFVFEVHGQVVSDAQWIFQDTTAIPIEVIANWKKGDTKEYRVTRQTRVFSGDSLQSEREELDGIARLIVEGTTSNAYKMS